MHAHVNLKHKYKYMQVKRIQIHVCKHTYACKIHRCISVSLSPFTRPFHSSVLLVHTGISLDDRCIDPRCADICLFWLRPFRIIDQKIYLSIDRSIYLCIIDLSIYRLFLRKSPVFWGSFCKWSPLVNVVIYHRQDPWCSTASRMLNDTVVMSFLMF